MTMKDPVRRSLIATSVSALTLLTACVGPAYVKPKVDSSSSFKEGVPATTDADAWRPAQPQDAVLKGKWWEMFNEPELNALEEQLNINNENIALYFQNFIAAREQVKIARAGYFPTLTAAPAANRVHTSSALRGTSGTTTTTGAGAATGTGTTTGTSISTAGATTNEFSMPFDVSWEPDLFGRIRNTVRASRYAAQVSAADLENERLTEQATLAEYFFQLRGQDSLQDLFNRTIAAQKQSLDLTQALLDTGIDSPEDVAQAEVTLRNTEANAVGVATNRAIYEHAIATLIGKPASDFSMPVRMLATPVPAIAVGVPSQLLQRRPDIAAAERTMAQANAQIGVGTAAYFPTLDLTGSGGWEASAIQDLFTAPARFWSLGATVSETIFDGGLRRATVRQYTAQFDADVASYRLTVLTAFQQVEDYIATVRIVSEQIERQKLAVAAARRYLDIATSRYQTGLDPYLNVMTAETTLLSDQQTEVMLRVNEMTAAVQLIQALGGGWDTGQLPEAGDIATQKVAEQLK
jgi:NodT family efflux transporter outer membrane factor (OMF) lipoprotein